MKKSIWVPAVITLAGFIIVSTVFFVGKYISPVRSNAEVMKLHKQLEVQIAMASQYLKEDNASKAIVDLEMLHREYPDSPEILEILAFAYSQNGNINLAAATFEKVSHVSKEYQENALYAAQAYREANNLTSAARNYHLYLEVFPKDSTAWKELAYLALSMKDYNVALQSYLTSLDVSDSEPTVDDYVSVGRLFFEVNNISQARFWLEKALDANFECVEAHLLMLHIEFQNEMWAAAKQRIQTIDNVDNQALDKSQLAYIRAECYKWEKAQIILANQKLEEDLKNLKQEKKILLETSKSYLLKEQMQKYKAFSRLTANFQEEFQQTRNNFLIEKDLEEKENCMPLYKNLQMFAATQKKDFPVMFSQMPGVFNNMSNKDSVDSITQFTCNRQVDISAIWEGDELCEVETKKDNCTTQKDLLQKARKLHAEDKKENAVVWYEKAILQDHTQGFVWYELSRVLLDMNKLNNAEMTILEALRRNSQDLEYVLHYLKIVQKKHSPQMFMHELKKAKRKFPNSSELSLVLGRGYEKIEKNLHNALNEYQAFLRLASPTHPERKFVQLCIDGIMH